MALNFQNMLGLSPAADAFPMTEATGGLWYITVQPPAGANWYGYNFTVDGAHVADPNNRNIWTGTPGSFSAIGAWSMVMVPGAASQYMADVECPAWRRGYGGLLLPAGSGTAPDDGLHAAELQQ